MLLLAQTGICDKSLMPPPSLKFLKSGFHNTAQRCFLNWISLVNFSLNFLITFRNSHAATPTKIIRHRYAAQLLATNQRLLNRALQSVRDRGKIDWANQVQYLAMPFYSLLHKLLPPAQYSLFSGLLLLYHAIAYIASRSVQRVLYCKACHRKKYRLYKNSGGEKNAMPSR